MHIYVHIPFCARKCPYCGFYSVEGVSNTSPYLAALRKEIIFSGIVPSASYEGEVSTVYFGGGTPSYADAQGICATLTEILEKFGISDGEFTIEVNPNSFTADKGRMYREAGFNRISIGVQSLHDDVLKTLGRLHSSSEALAAIEAAKEAGFTNISCDLILGVPGETLEGLYEDADKLINAGAKHISMYSLMIEEGTPFEDLYGGKLDQFVDEDLERRMYHGLRDHFDSKGLHPYEISNCAYKGFESRHNLAYWKGREYYAFGAGAHGYLDSVRFMHEENIEKYLLDPIHVEVEETLSERDKVKEKIMLALRTSEGVNKTLTQGFEELIDKNIKAGYLEVTGNGYRLSRKGLDFANLVFMDFI